MKRQALLHWGQLSHSSARLQQTTVRLSMDSYLLTDSDVELERLQLQARVWEPAATALLAEIGLNPGERALDLGAGAMGIVRPLSKAVGTSGRVVAVDNDATQLSALKRWVQNEGLSNVDIVNADAFSTGLPAGTFDIVHVRFLFAPVGRDGELLAEMRRLVRPGGVLAIQEPNSSCWDFYPRHAAFTELKALILAAFRAAGGDFDAGRRTAGLLENIGCTSVETRAHVHVLGAGHPYRRLPVQFAQSLRPRILSSGLASAARLEELIASCESLAADPACRMTTFLVTQAWGRFPSAAQPSDGP
jgi:SAM-dependent methyltransferase